MPSQRVQVLVQEEHIPLYEEAVSTLEAAIDVGKDDEGHWVFTAFFEPHIPVEKIEKSFAFAETLTNTPVQPFVVEQILDEDWQKSMAYEFAPLSVGSFFIYSFETEVPEGMVGLHVPAGLAFGTGEHPTTAGCLELYESLCAEKEFRNGLDMGCGSAILAIAAAKAHDVPFLAVDISAHSVEVAQENVLDNACENRVVCRVSDGFSLPEIGYKAPYDIIFANILANPLIGMSSNIAQHLGHDGFAILSGFTENQKEEVYAAYEKQELQFVSETETDGWMATVFRK